MVATVTPTDRPKLVRNYCVIEVFGGVFVLSRCFLDFSVDVGAFVRGLSQSDLFLFLITKFVRLFHKDKISRVCPISWSIVKD